LKTSYKNVNISKCRALPGTKFFVVHFKGYINVVLKGFEQMRAYTFEAC
jgi:hypothetical protein